MQMEADDEVADPIVAIRAFARPGMSIMERTQRRDLGKLTECGKAFLVEEVQRLVRRNANQAVMVRVYGSDGTPMLTDRQWLRTLGSRVLRRRGKCGAEWLIDRTFIKGRDIEGHECVKVILKDPVVLTNKTAWGLAAALFARSPSLRELGHYGAALTVYSFDRGYKLPIERIVRRKHLLEASESSRSNSLVEGLLDFVLVLGDPMHDAMNGYEWGLRPFVGPESMKDIYISVCSVRNSYDQLMLHIEAWIVGVLAFGEPVVSEEFCQTLWCLLGLEPDVIVILVRYRAHWRDGRLLIDSSHKNDSDLIDSLVFALVGVWRFVRFSESRWLSLGPTSRALVAGEVTGISSLIEFVRKRPGASEYYIHGWDRRGKSGNAICVIAALAGGPAESFLEGLLQDDRIALNILMLEDGVRAALRRLEALDMQIFEYLATLTNKTAMELYTCVLQAARTSVAFFTFRCLRSVREEPFVYCFGDIKDNLLGLASGPQPCEPCSQQAWRLLRAGYPLEPLVEVWEQIKAAPWSTVGIEQLHAGAAQVHKLHPHLGRDILASRSFLWAMRALLSPEEAAARLEKMQRQLLSLQQSIPNVGHISGRQVFLQEAMAEARHLFAGGSALSPAMSKAVMAQHAAEYGRLTSAQRRGYEKKAAEIVEQRRAGIRDNAEELRQRLSLERQRLQEETMQASPWRLSSCRLSDIEKDTLRRMYRSGSYSRSKVDQLRTSSAEAPPIPSLDFRLRLMACEVPSADKPVPPAWVRTVCQRREEFVGVAVLVKKSCAPEDFDAFLVSWAFKSPIILGLIPLRRRPWDLSHGECCMDALNAHWDYDFDVLDEYICSDEGDMIDDAGQIMVLTGLVQLPGGRAASSLKPLAFEDFVADLPVPAREPTQAAPRASAASASAKAKFVQEHPWALEFLGDGHQLVRKESQKRGASSAEDDDTDEDPGDEVDCLGEVGALFEAMRKAKDAVGDEAMCCFRTRPLMGKWTLLNTGIVCDAYQCRAVGDEAVEFALTFGIQQPLRFATSLYGPEGALTCCRYWCAKLSFFYQLWLDSGACGFPFTDEALRTWQEPEAFSALARACTAPDAQARFAFLRGLRPSTPA